MMTNKTVALNNIETKEISKEVRKELKQLHPQIKFSVRSDFNTIRIQYIDGICDDDVEAVAKKYSGRGGWDSNYCDYTTNSPVLFRGEMVYTSLIYIFVTRKFSYSYLQEVVDYVQATSTNNQENTVTVKTHKDGTACLDSNDWESLKIYREIAHRCSSTLSIAVQEKLLADEKEKEYLQWEQHIDIATAKLEEELQQQEQATPIVAKVKSIEPIFIDGQFAKINKNSSLEEYHQECQKINGYKIEKCQVIEIIELSSADYDQLCWRLLEDFEWLAGKGGDGSTANLRNVKDWFDYTQQEKELWCKEAYRICVLIFATNRDAFLVDPQGYNYARYVGFVDQQAIATHLSNNQSNIIQFPSTRQGKQVAIEIITEPYPIEPVELPFLKMIEIITTQELKPLELSFLFKDFNTN